MTKSERLRLLKKRALPLDCKACNNTGMVKPGHRYGGCLGCLNYNFANVTKRELHWLCELAQLALENRNGLRAKIKPWRDMPGRNKLRYEHVERLRKEGKIPSGNHQTRKR